MKQKIYNFLNKVYAAAMTGSFFAGGLPVVGFVFALVVGGELGQGICIFLAGYYYPVAIVLASISVLVGLLALYIKKDYGFSVDELNKSEGNG